MPSCPHCSHDVSPDAKNCPKCGDMLFDMWGNRVLNAVDKTDKFLAKVLYKIIVYCSAIFASGAIGLFAAFTIYNKVWASGWLFLLAPLILVGLSVKAVAWFFANVKPYWER